MNEQVLQFVWRHRLFDAKGLMSVEGKPIEIIEVGTQSLQSLGPDFLNAHIRIEGTDWHGAVEIHLDEDDWLRHKHNDHPKYTNVILHVVIDTGKRSAEIRPKPVATLSLKSRINPDFLNRYTRLSQVSQVVMCSEWNTKISDERWMWFRSHLLTERLIRKSQIVEKQYEKLNRNWEFAFIVQMAMKLGGRVNGHAFAQVIIQIGRESIIQLRRRSVLEIEAVLFGVLGVLNQGALDEYTSALETHWAHLQALFRLEPQPIEAVKGGVRPQNNFYLRLSQLASVISQFAFQIPLPFGQHVEVFNALLSGVQANPYWQSHSALGQSSQMRLPLAWSEAYKRYLVVNLFVPFRLAFSRKATNQVDLDLCIALLSELKAEQNMKTKALKAQLANRHAADSQALIECYDTYCQAKKCTQCALGEQILNEK